MFLRRAHRLVAVKNCAKLYLNPSTHEEDNYAPDKLCMPTYKLIAHYTHNTFIFSNGIMNSNK